VRGGKGKGGKWPIVGLPERLCMKKERGGGGKRSRFGVKWVVKEGVKQSRNTIWEVSHGRGGVVTIKAKKTEKGEVLLVQGKGGGSDGATDQLSWEDKHERKNGKRREQFRGGDEGLKVQAGKGEV